MSARLAGLLLLRYRFSSPVDYYVYCGNRQEGPFPVEVIRERIARGELAPTDLCFSQNMIEWTPISQVADLLPPPLPTPTVVPKPSFWQSVLEKLGVTVRLTHRQALRKKLELSDLQTADHRTGLQAYEKKLAPESCAAIVAQIDDITKQIADLDPVAPTPSADVRTVAGTAKAAAHATSKVAKVQSLHSRQVRLVRQLGEAIRQGSSVPELGTEVSAAQSIIGRMDTLDREIAALSSQTYPWARQPLVILSVVSVLILSVVGLSWLHHMTGPAPYAYLGQMSTDPNKLLADQLARQHAQQAYVAERVAQSQAAEAKYKAELAQQYRAEQEARAQTARKQAEAVAALEKQREEAAAEQQAAQAAQQKAAEAANQAAAALRPGVLWPGGAKIADYAAGGGLWNLATNQQVSANWSASGRALQPVRDDDSLIFGSNGPPTAGLAATAFTADPTGLTTPGFKYGGPSSSTQVPSGMVMSSDYRRVVYIEKGDIWRGEYDWQHQAVINQKQLTQTGAFDGKHILLWYGNVLLIDARLSPEKPIVRLDLATGEMQQFPATGAFGPGMMINPGGYLVYRPDGDVLYTYDARNGETRLVPNAVRIYEGTHSLNLSILTNTQTPSNWLGDDDAICTLSYLDQPERVIVRLNVKTGRAHLLAKSRVPVKVDAILPDRFVEAIPDGQPNVLETLTADDRRSFLLDPETGARTTLPFGNKGYHAWLDATHCLYGITSDDASQCGTWLYDRASNRSTRVFSHVLYSSPKPCFLADGVTYYFATVGSEHLFRTKLGDSNPPQELSCPANVLPITATPIDLGLGHSASPLWGPPVYTAAQQQADALVLPPSGPDIPGNLFTVLDALKDRPAAVRDQATRLYNYCIGSSYYYDPAKFALTLLPYVEKDPNAQLEQLVKQVNLSAALSTPVMENAGYSWAMIRLAKDVYPPDPVFVNGMPQNKAWTQEQREAIANDTGARLVRIVTQNPRIMYMTPTTSGYLNDPMRSAYLEACYAAERRK